MERDEGRAWGVGPVDVDLDAALRWAHATADVVKVKIGNAEGPFEAVSLDELRTRVGTAHVPRDLHDGLPAT